jgi:hypothetical protein
MVLVYGVECVVLNGEYVCLGVGLCLVVLFEKGESISRGYEVDFSLIWRNKICKHNKSVLHSSIQTEIQL